ncbi:MAG: hypothetical protein K1W31_19395 [Lachnospiraceae bacterium]
MEIIYNCPFILLVIFTGIIFSLFFDETGKRKNEQEAALSQLVVEGERADDLPGKDEIELENICNKHEESGEKTVDQARQEEKTIQNAGKRKEKDDKIENNSERKTDIRKRENAEKTGEMEKRATEFVEYEPIATDSRYYSDAGKVALTTTYDYVKENESYFNDAAFLGDSRTLGISDYAGLDGADFFCDNGMTIYKLLGDDGVTYQKTGEKVDLKEILQEKCYGKIYIMLGMNELGYGDTPMYLKQYLKVIRQIQEWQPGVIIYVMANLHVSLEKNNMETEFNNININDKNVASARLANGKDVFYLDCNPLFTDEEGYLQAELTFDGVHLYAQHYDKWREFLFEHGVECEAVQHVDAAGRPEGVEETSESGDLYDGADHTQRGGMYGEDKIK